MRGLSLLFNLALLSAAAAAGYEAIHYRRMSEENAAQVSKLTDNLKQAQAKIAALRAKNSTHAGLGSRSKSCKTNIMSRSAFLTIC